METLLAEVTRGEMVESVHYGAAVVADVSGRVIARVGDPDHTCYFRSCAKPFQTVPLVESGAADAFALAEAEVAICCASHNATAAQQALVSSILAKIGLPDEALHCGFSPPLDEEEAARVALGLKPKSPVEYECSGEHVGMLATCVHNGYPIDSYLDADHPLQRRIRAIIAAVTRTPEVEIALGTDGCGIPTFGGTLRGFATAYATLAAPEDAPEGAGRELAPSLIRLRTAMTSYPENIAGPGELDTDLMEVSGGAVAAKSGAEGLLCLAVPARGVGVAIRAMDGSRRAHHVIAARLLEDLGLISPAVIAVFFERQSPAVTNFLGETVGEIRTTFQLDIF